ncbi:Transmembrane protein 94 [Bagarius yarrelli]|uniref:Transmembrane protein 94 n=1 Tax=Bagarius yarrelli TaxID=175774 RepID=A0A556VAB9_BAGYA|nr:Transmembrane protein 94 [Bagarius yarrelli]
MKVLLDSTCEQWTYRDGRLVNLPVSLLVEGDIISLRPGSEAPTELRGIQPPVCPTPLLPDCLKVQEEEHVILSQSDVFSHLSSPPSPLDHKRSRPHRLLQPKLFRVTRTPAVEVVQRCLELSQHRPVSVLDNERFTVQTLLERGPAPLALPRPFAGLEMLSLSLDRARFNDTRVQFDDMQWERHAPSLRPLGLAIQLLLGDATVATRMLRLTDHLTHAALLRTRPPCQPVRPPWGLCQLPKLLGEFQLFSYGSADAVLSTCSEFWNGEDLQLLTDSDRKKVVDFYQRSCMAGQCVTVSFKPLLHPHDPEIDGMCVELPPSLSNEDAEDVLLSPLKQQVFLGLVSSQYQELEDSSFYLRTCTQCEFLKEREYCPPLRDVLSVCRGQREYLILSVYRKMFPVDVVDAVEVMLMMLRRIDHQVPVRRAAPQHDRRGSGAACQSEHASARDTRETAHTRGQCATPYPSIGLSSSSVWSRRHGHEW